MAAPGTARAGREQRFSLLSRGDRVYGRAILPAKPGPHPVIVLAPADGCASSELCARAAALWVARAALIAFDLPLCGARRSDKLTALALDPTLPIARRLRPDLEAQVAADLEAILAWIAAHPELDRARVTLAGVGLGAELARPFADRPAPVAHVALTKDDPPPATWLREVLERAAGV